MTIFFRLLNLCSIGGGVLLYYYPNIVNILIKEEYHILLYLLLSFIFGLSLLSWFIRTPKTAYILNDLPYALKAPMVILQRILYRVISPLGIVVIVLFFLWFAENHKSVAHLLPVLKYIASAICLLIGLYLYNYGVGIIINTSKNSINFPAKNRLTSFKEFITCRFILGQFFRRTVKFTDISYVHSINETKKITLLPFMEGKLSYEKEITIKKYLLNCAGNFGSFYLSFSSAQKRDEAIAIIKTVAKELNHKIEFRNVLY